MVQGIPSAQALIREALATNPTLDVNSLHAKVFDLMVHYRSEYYEASADSFLSSLDLPEELKIKIKRKMLKPVIVGDKEYSNFMEEVSRRISQAFQPISGNVAELCVERELAGVGLVKNVNFTRREGRTDFTVYHPDTRNFKSRHRIEVKNVKIRERATRGLLFDGDSLFGFFDDEGEFTEPTTQLIDSLCEKTGGYCYMPPATLKKIPYNAMRLRPNTLFARDMLGFARVGKVT
jgi:hypothetical protein